MMFVVTHWETNAFARDHFGTKCIRALKHSHGLSTALFRESRPASLGGQETVTIQADRERFDRVMEHTCRALFFHEFGRKFTDRLFVWSPAFRYPNYEPDEQLSALGYHARQVLKNQAMRGQNQKAFWYQLSEKPGQLTAFRLMFFEGCDVYAASMPEVA